VEQADEAEILPRSGDGRRRWKEEVGDEMAGMGGVASVRLRLLLFIERAWGAAGTIAGEGTRSGWDSLDTFSTQPVLFQQ
jgi:hypothetical protein